MTVLEDVMNMKSQGISDSDITYTLQQKGISPKEIKNSFDQAQIKMAIADNPTEDTGQYAPEEQPQQDYPQEQAQQQEMYPMNQDYSQEGYQSSSPADSDATLEIAEQVFEEKIKSFKKELDKFNEFKNLTQSKVDNLSERLKRIEDMLDKLQMSILEKVGSYGQDLGAIKKEMSMIEDSFSKVVSPFLDKTEKSSQSNYPQKTKEPNLEDLATKRKLQKEE